MRARLVNLWDDFHSSFWFVPIVMGMSAIVLAVVSSTIDSVTDEAIERNFSWLVTTPSAARSTLTAISSATITLVCVVFSITIVTVTMASSQFGSRLLRTYMTDSIADRVMGVFVGTSLYCLVILRFVREKPDADDPFVPQLSTALALVFGLICVVFLIWFVHHVSVSLQATTIVSGVSRELKDAIDRLFPDRIADSISSGSQSDQRSLPPVQVELSAQTDGYVQGIDYDALRTLAATKNGVIELKTQPGQFVISGSIVAQFRTNSEIANPHIESIRSGFRTALILGSRRTPRQDVSCSIYELVEIAVRAMSPGINDPFTAINCIDRIGAAMSRLATRMMPSPFLEDDDGELRVVAVPVTFVEILKDAYSQTRQYGIASEAVAMRLIESLENVIRHAVRADDVIAIRDEADKIRSAFLKTEPLDEDFADFQERFERLSELLPTIS